MSNKRIAVAIVLFTAILAVVGVTTSFFSITTAVGVAVVGIVIGTGVRRGAFSSSPDATKKH